MNSKKKKREIGNIVYSNKNIGFSITIPDNWMEVKKTSYKDLGINNNTLLIFAVDKFTSLTAIFSGFCKTKSFNKFFENFSCDDHFKILYKGENKEPKIHVKQLIVEYNDKKIMHNFCLINGMIINFTINIDVKNRIFDAEKLVDDQNFKLINKIINTIKVFEPVNPPIYIEEVKKEIKENEVAIVAKETIPEKDKKEVKKLSQLMIEKDCKYKNTIVPSFYFNYTYTRKNEKVKLNILNNEIYFSGFNDCFRIIKEDSELAIKIEKIILENWLELLKMDFNDDKNLSDSNILIKINDSYGLIDLNNKNNNMNLLRNVFNNIVLEIKKVTNTNFNEHLLFPMNEEENKRFEEFIKEYDENHKKEKENESFQEFIKEYDENHKKEKENESFQKFLKEYDEVHRKEKEERLFQEFLKEYEKRFAKEKENIAFQKFLKEYDEKRKKEEEEIIFQNFLEDYEKKLKKKKEDEQFRQFLVQYEKKLIKEKENEKFREFLIFEDTKRRKELEYILQKNSQKEDTRLNIYKVPGNNDKSNAKEYNEENDIEEIVFDKEEKNQVNENIVVSNLNQKEQPEKNNEEIHNVKNISKDDYSKYDLKEFQEFLHNVDGHASFKFLFPKDTGEKLIRDFNVFDINKDDELVYRIFLFKCRDVEKYESKIENWMTKNVESSNTSIVDKYSSTTENNLEVKTYILENGKFYKIAYIYGYLIAISGNDENDRMLLANIALDTVEIGEDSKSYVEACDRKIRSINTLRAQGIPYIEELPPIASSYEVIGKNLEEIAKRAIVLCIVCNFASDIVNNKKKRYLKDSKKFFIKLLETYNVKDVLTKEEKELFDDMNKNLAIQISWQFEGYAILLWTLGLIDEVEFPDILIDPDTVTSVVSICDSYNEFVGKCRLRNVHDVLDLADLTYRYNWYCIESQINGEEPIMNPEVVMERHRALNWLLSDKEWDKVEINT